MANAIQTGPGTEPADVIAFDGKFVVGSIAPPAIVYSVRPGETYNFEGVGLVDTQHQTPQFPTCKAYVSTC